MKNQNFIDDLLAMGNDMLTNAFEGRHDFKSQAKQRVQSIARNLDLVGRGEFEIAFAMLSKYRNTQEDILSRLSKIESHLNLSRPKKKVKTKKSNLPSVKTKNGQKRRK